MNSNRTWIEIDAQAFDHNASQYKRIIGNRDLAFVIKANGYGHGIEPLGHLAEHTDAITWLCVATISEALDLRKWGIRKPILVMATFDQEPSALINQNIHTVVFDLGMIRQLNETGKQYNYIFPVHLKVDTGLSRLGVKPEKAIDIVRFIQSCSNISLQGIYSHFAESSNQDSSFTLHQVEQFKAVLDQLSKEGITIPSIHLANSAGTMLLDLPFCTMFRVGCGIYGLWPNQSVKERTQHAFPWFDLRPIGTWKTTISHINTIAKGNPIGYDRTFIAPHDMRIATIPTGYYDGYDFRLFNKASVLINERYAPIVGRIAMNMTIIDITDVPSAQIGNEVILMGPYPQIDAAHLGLLAGNPNVREITTKINPTILRTIVNNSGNLPYTNATTKINKLSPVRPELVEGHKPK